LSSDIRNYSDSSVNCKEETFICDSDATTISNKNIKPIKFVDKTLSTKQKKVVNGTGTCSTVVAVPNLMKKGVQTAKRV